MYIMETSLHTFLLRNNNNLLLRFYSSSVNGSVFCIFDFFPLSQQHAFLVISAESWKMYLENGNEGGDRRGKYENVFLYLFSRRTSTYRSQSGRENFESAENQKP